jgi:hypothetical protein
VPANRVLSLHAQAGQVLVTLPTGSTVQLLELQIISCTNFANEVTTWTPLSGQALTPLSCPEAHPKWDYIVSALGYEIVSCQAFLLSSVNPHRKLVLLQTFSR